MCRHERALYPTYPSLTLKEVLFDISSSTTVLVLCQAPGKLARFLLSAPPSSTYKQKTPHLTNITKFSSSRHRLPELEKVLGFERKSLSEYEAVPQTV